MRSVVMVLAGAGLLVASLPAAAQQDAPVESQIRGASVTVEEGVRVIRPLRPGCSQPDACPRSRTYLHRIGDQSAPNRFLRRLGTPRTARGIP